MTMISHTVVYIDVYLNTHGGDRFLSCVSDVSPKNAYERIVTIHEESGGVK